MWRSTARARAASCWWPITRRNWRSASNMPAAVHLRAISPEDQRFTLRCVRRTISIMDSIGWLTPACALSCPVIPSRCRRTRRWLPLVHGSARPPSQPRRVARHRLAEADHLLGGEPSRRLGVPPLPRAGRTGGCRPCSSCTGWPFAARPRPGRKGDHLQRRFEAFTAPKSKMWLIYGLTGSPALDRRGYRAGK
jgi:hypothetical protein